MISWSPAHRWLASAAGTVASVYALDGIATATGGALEFSPLLDRASLAKVLVVLAGSYLLSAAAFRVALDANWALLDATGATCNLASLVAYQFVRHRTDCPRLHRLAAGVGYVGTELVKEAPYYLAAFGTAAVSAQLTSRDALIFLAGTNLGAAAYEYVFGCLVRLGLRRISVSAGRLRASVA